MFFGHRGVHGRAPYKNLTFIVLQRLPPAAVRSRVSIDKLMPGGEHRKAD